jgi:hypothetical protein
MRTERTWTMAVARLLSCMVFGFAACTVPATDVADDDRAEDHDNVGTVEQEHVPARSMRARLTDDVSRSRREFAG